MTQLEVALTNILGYFPYYMRPPYLATNPTALDTLRDLEYIVIKGDLNTQDWKYQSPSLIANAEQTFLDGLAAGQSIVEAHDPDSYTASDLVPFMIETVQNRSIKSKTWTTWTGRMLTRRSCTYRRMHGAGAGGLVSHYPTPTVIYHGRCINSTLG